jgi:outer membrane protein
VNNRVLGVAALVLGAAVAAFGQAAAPTKVGIINIQAAIIGTREGQAAAKALEEKSAPKKKQLEAQQGEINSLRDKLNKMSSVGSEEEKRKLMADIDQKTKSFNRAVEDAQSELDQEQNKVLNELGGRMLAVLDKYAKDNGYAIILDVSNQNTPVLFAANSIDVTQEVVALYDKNAPPAAAAPPSGAAVTAPKPTAPAAGTGAASPKPTVPAATKPAAAPKK